MKRTLITAAAVALFAPAAMQAQASARDITLRGCVTPGLNDTYLLTHVNEVPAPGKSAMPAEAHGRRVVFWLDRDADVKTQAGHMVEIHGTFDKFEDSAIELKAGPRVEGGLIAEFEGPGRDVKVPNQSVEKAIGTSGRIADGVDIKTLLVRVAVRDVRSTGTCQ